MEKKRKSRLRWYSMIPNARPYWLMDLTYKLTSDMENLTAPDNPEVFFHELEKSARVYIRDLVARGSITRSEVTTHVATDDRTTLTILRNDRPVQTFYLE